MRIDKFLKVSRLLKRRATAQQACESNKVLVNGRVSKPSKQLTIGDIVAISYASNTVTFKVLSLSHSTKKDDASTMYEIIV